MGLCQRQGIIACIGEVTLNEETRPSIMCVAHQMVRKKRKDPVGWTMRYEMINYKVIPVRS